MSTLDPETGPRATSSRMTSGPNGLAFSPDETKLYIVESRACRPARSAHTTWRRTALSICGKQDGLMTPDRGTPDGFRVDVQGQSLVRLGMGAAELDGVDRSFLRPNGDPIAASRSLRDAPTYASGAANSRLFMARATPFTPSTSMSRASPEGT
jgi:gluconolactonase